MSKLSIYYLIPVWANIFTVYFILFSDMTLIESIIIGISIAVGSGLILFVILRYIGGKLDRKKEDKKERKKELIDRILRNLRLLIIEYDNYRIWMNDLDKIKKQKEYELTMQHLKAYSDILNPWNNSNEQISAEDGLNIKLGKIKDFVSGEINSKPGENYIGLLSSVWSIIKGAFPLENIKGSDDMNKFLDSINIELRNKVIYVDSEDSTNLVIISGGKMGVHKVKKFLSDLIANTEFRNKVTEIKIKNDELEKIFNDGFKKKLNEFLKDIKGKEEDFKGKCEYCKWCIIDYLE